MRVTIHKKLDPPSSMTASSDEVLQLLKNWVGLSHEGAIKLCSGSVNTFLSMLL